MDVYLSTAVEDFLGYLADDILVRPESLEPLSSELAERIVALTAEVPVSLSDKIEGVVTL
jgi:antitoxin PrlF